MKITTAYVVRSTKVKLALQKTMVYIHGLNEDWFWLP